MMYSKLLKRYISIQHGFSTKKDNFNNNSVQFLQQIHSADVVVLSNNQVAMLKGDALITKTRQQTIGVKTADCVPILLYEPKANIVGAVHAGWRGTLRNIVFRTVNSMQSLNGKPSNIIVAFGPSIGMCCYDVPDARSEQFTRSFGKDNQMITKTNGKYYLNLAYTNYKQIRSAGVLSEHIDFPLICTSCQNDLFYSHRKEKGKLQGQSINYILLR